MGALHMGLKRKLCDNLRDHALAEAASDVQTPLAETMCLRLRVWCYAMHAPHTVELCIVLQPTTLTHGCAP